MECAEYGFVFFDILDAFPIIVNDTNDILILSGVTEFFKICLL